MGDDLRHRYAEALRRRIDPCNVRVDGSKATATSSLTPGVLDLADAVMAVRDEDLQAWRERTETAEQTVARVRAEIEEHADCEEWCCECTPKIRAALDTKEADHG